MGHTSKKKLFALGLVIILLVGFLIPQNFDNPVDNADKNSYNSKSYWFYPWGKSGTHKGVDIFAKEGTTVYSSTGGLVVFKGEIERGGNVVLIVGPKWRLHWDSWNHRKCERKISALTLLMTLIPYPWRIDRGKQGWKKMFYLNPITYFNEK
jgi:hypothetical protein